MRINLALKAGKITLKWNADKAFWNPVYVALISHDSRAYVMYMLVHEVHSSAASAANCHVGNMMHEARLSLKLANYLTWQVTNIVYVHQAHKNK